MKRRFRQAALFFALGLMVTCCVAVGLALWVDIGGGATAAASRGDWTMATQRATGSLRVTSERIKPSWCPTQATGAPDTPSVGDLPTAWAPATNNGAPEWLQLEYEKPCAPSYVDVYESYHPGALTRVTLVDEGGREIEVFKGDDPAKPSAGVTLSHIKMPSGVPTVKKVKLYQGRPDVPGWNEIDAVGLVDDRGQVQWAIDATASSWYGSTSYWVAPGGPARPESLIPYWSGLSVGPWHATVPADHDRRTVEARGWPMLALWAPAPEVSVPMTTGQSQVYMLSGAGVSATPQPKVMPYRPIILGLVVDSALYGAVLAAIWAMLVLPRRFFVELSRLRRGCCVRCGYDLGFDFPRGCPECGWRRDVSERAGVRSGAVGSAAAAQHRQTQQ